MYSYGVFYPVLALALSSAMAQIQTDLVADLNFSEILLFSRAETFLFFVFNVLILLFTSTVYSDWVKTTSVHFASSKWKKSQDVAGALEVWRYGGNSSRAQEDTGLLDKNSQSWFLSTLTLFFPWLFAVLAWTRSSIRAQENTGLLDKEALCPFGRPHEPTTFCFPRRGFKLLFEADLHSTSK